LRLGAAKDANISPIQARLARQAFYALCTHIDHQIRIVIGTLREEGLLNNTIICFTSDHGDMLGNHRQWAKRLFYEDSASVPMILLGAAQGVPYGRVDDRLVGWQDVMPTLLDLAGIDIPESVEGLSMVGETRRDTLYGEFGEGIVSTRMVRNGRYKLIYYAAGNCVQLFDLENDPREMTNLAASADHQRVLAGLQARLLEELYGDDLSWVEDGTLVGLPTPEFKPGPNPGLSGQRGVHWPPAPASFMSQI
jgi:arylsulfatase